MNTDKAGDRTGHPRLRIFLKIFAIIAIVLTLAPFIAVDYWWIRVFDFPHLQLTMLTMAAFGAYLFEFQSRNKSDYVLAGALIGCLIIQLYKVYEFMPVMAKEVPSANSDEQSDNNRQFTVATANVLQYNNDHTRFAEKFHEFEADIMLFTETHGPWERAIDSAVGTKYRFKKNVILDNAYGMMLYSKFPLIDPEVQYMVDDSVPSIQTLVRIPSGDTLRIFGIHPTPPMPQHNPVSTDRDAELMKVALASLNSEYPVIVLGDFNDVPWSQSTGIFRKTGGLLDPRKGRGFFNSFDATNPLARWPLDHIFVTEHFKVTTLSRGPAFGSDHFPVRLGLLFSPEDASERQPEPPTEQELERAKEQIIKEIKEE